MQQDRIWTVVWVVAIGLLFTLNTTAGLSSGEQASDSDLQCSEQSHSCSEDTDALPKCSCFTDNTNYCSCTQELGIINTDSFGNKVGGYDFEFDIPGGEDIEVRVWFCKADLVDLSDECFFIISGTKFETNEIMRDFTTVYTTTKEHITLSRPPKTGANCSIQLGYAAVVPKLDQQAIKDLSGSIQFPDPGSNLTALGYPPQIRTQWTFTYPSNYVLELNVTKLDLGWRESLLHLEETKYNSTSNDFLLIGVGTEMLESTSEVLLFGKQDKFSPIRVNSFTAHVVLYTTYHEQCATGFSIDYSAVEVSQPTTTTAVPTTTLPVLLPLPSSSISLNGAITISTNTSFDLENDFKTAIADIATQYINITGLAVELPALVLPSEVKVIQMTNCDPIACLDSCASFDYGIEKASEDLNSWAFTEEIMSAMVHEPDVVDKWAEISEECEYCSEQLAQNWWAIGGTALAVVVFAVLVSLAAWQIKGKSDHLGDMQAIEEDRQREELEKRRRSSGEMSKIGGIKGFSRTSLPFGRDRSSLDTVTSLKDEDYDTAGFTEFDPDFGFDDFGLGSDLLHDGSSGGSSTYANAGFMPDSPTHQRKYRQLMALDEEDVYNAANDTPSAKFVSLSDMAPSQPPPTSSSLSPDGVTFLPLKSSLKKKNIDEVNSNYNINNSTTININSSNNNSSNSNNGGISFKNDSNSSNGNNSISSKHSSNNNNNDESDDSDGALNFDPFPRGRINIEAEVHNEDTDMEESNL